eukprot:CAMPEP_0117617106 /NCGR_PEP_ID=MMETSP0784-20121206/85425_1 /TAXON_ID=39447 /ORGANISM="" /LENGTH=105 /DNA_ID=CAMNT_0005420945 /DNA_START=29 /DNA_END=346 /DNA_ORIENTATION=+
MTARLTVMWGGLTAAKVDTVEPPVSTVDKQRGQHRKSNAWPIAPAKEPPASVDKASTSVRQVIPTTKKGKFHWWYCSPNCGAHCCGEIPEAVRVQRVPRVPVVEL